MKKSRIGKGKGRIEKNKGYEGKRRKKSRKEVETIGNKKKKKRRE